MTGAKTSAIRPILAGARSNEMIAGLAVGESTFGRLFERQVHLAFRGTGAEAKRELVPLTRAAKQLLNGPDGPMFERAYARSRGRWTLAAPRDSAVSSVSPRESHIC